MLFVTDENELTQFQISQFVDPTGDNRAVMDSFPPDDFIESAAKKIISKHAESDGSVFAMKNVRRPFDEFVEVQKKRLLDLILDLRTELCPR
jgi:predicted flavoprotein YhiN